ncbi:MAG: toprim domain-containing protein [Hyphomicrobiales bacterium]|nr:toprim domain-containing protein [Hyphomicrobiales bacterium]
MYPHNVVESIHRTYLRRDGTGKASVEPNKMMLGSCGGGAVRFGLFRGDTLWITEGVETGLSVSLITSQPTWATLSTSGMKTVVLPPLDRLPHLRIAADYDDAGIAAAEALAARELAIGRDVRIAFPPKPGQDFNDVLREAAHGG